MMVVRTDTRAALLHEPTTTASRRSDLIIGAFFEVYNTLGYGFLEHLYLKALQRELFARGHKVDCEV